MLVDQRKRRELMLSLGDTIRVMQVAYFTLSLICQSKHCSLLCCHIANQLESCDIRLAQLGKFCANPSYRVYQVSLPWSISQQIHDFRRRLVNQLTTLITRLSCVFHFGLCSKNVVSYPMDTNTSLTKSDFPPPGHNTRETRCQRDPREGRSKDSNRITTWLVAHTFQLVRLLLQRSPFLVRSSSKKCGYVIATHLFKKRGPVFGL